MPTTWPLSLISVAVLELPPKVPRSMMEYLIVSAINRVLVRISTIAAIRTKRECVAFIGHLGQPGSIPGAASCWRESTRTASACLLVDPRFEIRGLPWIGENKGELIRLPNRLKGE